MNPTDNHINGSSRSPTSNTIFTTTHPVTTRLVFDDTCNVVPTVGATTILAFVEVIYTVGKVRDQGKFDMTSTTSFIRHLIDTCINDIIS